VIKEIQVYILAQQGRKDREYLYPESSIVVGDPRLNAELSHTWTAADLSDKVGPDWRNYRWKVYSIVVRPKNL
jgi:hypothetical protein